MEVINIYKPIHLEVERGDFVYEYYSINGKVERHEGRVLTVWPNDYPQVDMILSSGECAAFGSENVIAWGALKW